MRCNQCKKPISGKVAHCMGCKSPYHLDCLTEHVASNAPRGVPEPEPVSILEVVAAGLVAAPLAPKVKTPAHKKRSPWNKAGAPPTSFASKKKAVMRDAS